MIAIAFILLLAVGVIWTTATLTRAVSQQPRAEPRRSIDQDLVEARLIRIEEAIDAMANQIERLTEHQRAMLGGSEPPRPPDDSYRPEPRR